MNKKPVFIWWFLGIAMPFLFLCTANIENPFTLPENAKASLIIIDSNQHISSSNEITDTVGKPITIGVCPYLYNFVDSITVTVAKDAGNPDVSFKGHNFKSDEDTQWVTFSIKTKGIHNVIARAYFQGGNTRDYNGIITIVGKTLAAVVKPVTDTEKEGDASTFIALVQGDTNLTYQWFRNQTILPGKTGPTLTIAGLTASDSGLYSCRTADQYGDTAVSNSAHLAVIPKSIVKINTKPQLTITGRKSYVIGEICTLSVSVTDPDSGASDTVSVVKAPAGYSFVNNIFVFKPAAAFSGTDSVVFAVVDNGTPQLADTQTVQFTMSASIPLPDSITGLKAISRNNGIFVFSWNKSKNADLYKIYRGRDTLSFSLFKTISDTTISNLINDTAFYYYIVASNSQGVSKSSLRILSTTINVPPKWVHDTIRIEIPENSSISLNLADSITDANGDKITYQMVTGDPLKNSLVFSTWKDTATYSDSGEKVIKIQASDGIGSPSVLTILLHITNVNRPPAFIANMPKATYDVSGNAVLSFPVKASDPDGDTPVISISSTTLKRPTTAILKNDSLNWTSNVGDSGTYQVILKAKDKTDSVLITVTVLVGSNLPVPSAPTLLSPADGAAAQSPGTTLRWNSVAYANTYHVQVSTSSTFGTIVLQDSTLNDTSKTFAGLSNGTTYFWRVSARNSSGKGDWSASRKFSTKQQFMLNMASVNGTVTKTPNAALYDSGTVVGLKAVPNTGYQFVTWSGDTAGTSDSISIVMNNSKNDTANFSLKSFQLTVSAQTGGTITVPSVSPATVNYGQATTINAVPNAGYTFVNWTVPNGTATIANANNASTTVTLITGNASVTANFTGIFFTINASAGANGSISPAGSKSVPYNGSQSYTITPNTGFAVANLLIDGVSQAAAPSYTFNNVTANHSISVTFSQITYMLSTAVSPNGGGTVSPSSSTPVNYGVNTTITATAAGGYKFVNWVVTTGSGTIASSTSASTTISLTSGNATVTANFAALACSWSVILDAGSATNHFFSVATNGNTILLGVQKNGLQISPDNGKTWSSGPGFAEYGYCVAQCGGVSLYGTGQASLGPSIYSSTNNGSTWTTNTPGSDVHAFALVGTSTLYAGTDAGVLVSTNNGASWSTDGRSISNVQALIGNGSYVYAGTNSGLSYTTPSGIYWNNVSGFPSTSVSALAICQNTLFAGTAGGVVKLDNNSGTWSAVNTGLPSGVAISSLAVSGTYLFAGTSGNGVYLSTNNGENWGAVNTGLPSGSYVSGLAVNSTSIFMVGNSYTAYKSLLPQ